MSTITEAEAVKTAKEIQQVFERQQPFRVSSVSEMAVIRGVYRRAAGRGVTLVENAWGFPWIPLPSLDKKLQDPKIREEIITARGELVSPHLVPRSISNGWFGHPIFWIDPELTAPTTKEQQDSSRWGIRMFYLMLGLGLIHPDTLDWLNAPMMKGVEYTDSDIDRYLALEPTPLDSVVFNEEDLFVSLDDINLKTDDTLVKIFQMQSEQKSQLLVSQNAAYQDSVAVLDQEDIRWSRIVERADEIAQMISSRSQPTSTLVNDLFEVTNFAVDHLTEMDRVASILLYPTLSIEGFTSSEFSKLMDFSRTINQKIHNQQYTERLHEVVNEYVRHDGFDDEQSLDTGEHTVLGEVLNDLYEVASARLDNAKMAWEHTRSGGSILATPNELALTKEMQEVASVVEESRVKRRQDRMNQINEIIDAEVEMSEEQRTVTHQESH